MTILMKKVGVFPDGKSPDDEYAVSVDITTWLGEDTIDDVEFTAQDEDGNDATADVIDDLKSVYTSYIIYPYVIGGEINTIYNVYLDVDTTEGDHATFYLQFRCNNLGS